MYYAVMIIKTCALVHEVWEIVLKLEDNIEIDLR